MFKKIILKPTAIFLMIGFSISMTSVLIGISLLDKAMKVAANGQMNIPIFETMVDSGFSLMVAIYIFSVANCLVVTNYWMITRKRTMVIQKAFGWTSIRIIISIIHEMMILLIISLSSSCFLIIILSSLTSGELSVEITPFFIIGTVILLLVTLCVSMIVPIYRVLKIQPAEVVQ